ncbi:excisionase [Marinobacterium iners]|uniref:response regulator n=1 Tax=Marinobacterium iners TaxID=48076 RepID=UPI001A8FB5AD|nr:response regulator [Marinobacterium iners]QSR34607.1 excisionase [Marinobacterium iners]
MTDKTVLSSAEAAKQLNVSLRTIQLWVEQDILPAWRTPGGHRRIPAEAVAQLIAQQQAQVAQHTPKKPDRPLKILLVEDEVYLRKLYSKYLVRLHVQVELEVAENGFQGLIKLGEIKPDLLITDLMMPAMDGCEMIRSIRKGQYLPDNRIVVVTAMDPSSAEVADLRQSGLQVLHKPLLLEDLKQLLEQYLGEIRTTAPVAASAEV